MLQPIFRSLVLLLAGAGAMAAEGSPFEFASAAGVNRGEDLIGRVVETRDGRELGRIHDFAVDLDSGRVAYVVVSVGSFLIDDSLIAVEPQALRASADADGRLILEADADSVRAARRFAAGNWPRRADVLADVEAGAATPAADVGKGENAEAAEAERGTATISDGSKTATLSAGERSIKFVNPPPPPESQEADVADGDRTMPPSRFDRLDRNGDGTLDRAEIAHELSRDDRYADIDTDGSGGVDRAEFDALQSRRESSGED